MKTAMENIINTTRSFKIRNEWLKVIKEYNRKEVDWSKRRENKNANRILAEKYEEKKQSGKQTQRKESSEKDRQGVFYLVRQSIATII